MDGFANGYNQPLSAWQEHRTPDGRMYYHNSSTNVTQWTKPEEMMTPSERSLANQPWKEYSAAGGRKYWVNSDTKESSWEMPAVYKQALGVADGPNLPAAPQSTFTSGNGYPNRAHEDHREYRDNRDHRDHRDYRETIPESRQLGFSSDPKAQAFVPASNDPEYSTYEEAEQAFFKLLKRSGVHSDWTWEQAIRATARDPQFRAIKDPKDRKTAFAKFCEEMISSDKERAKERLVKLRTDFETMLRRHPEITHYTRWKTARPMIEGETLFRSTDNEEERRQLFEEYIIGLKKAHGEKQSAQRKSAMDGLHELLPKLNLEPYTRWADAQDTITSTTPFQADKKYQALTQFDILNAFQSHMKALERTFNDSKQHDKNLKFRRERQARDAYKSLLADLRRNGKINAGTKWSTLVSLMEKDERYTNMAGLHGSSPQELFWDIVEEEELNLRGPRNDVLDVLQDKRYELTPTSDFEEYLSIVKDDRRTANMNPEIVKLIFDRLREKRTSRHEDDRQPDRRQRHAIEDLRAVIKRLEPPVGLRDTYEKVRPRLLKFDEFQAVSTEDFRRSAFDKHIRRLKERAEDADRSHRRRDVGSSERDLHRRERDRSRGERSHRSGGGRGGRRSRSPEPDAYEADRRRAIAEREKNHRKSSMAENLLSSERGRLSPPPPARRERAERDLRERERDRDRDRDYDRHARSRRDDDSHYDRERRDREEEREKQYRRRADRGSYDELPYGDERPAGSRRRRPDDEDDYSRRDSRDSKRVRREKSRERTPPIDSRQRNRTPPPAPKDVHSGSEEGEIEEEE